MKLNELGMTILVRARPACGSAAATGPARARPAAAASRVRPPAGVPSTVSKAARCRCTAAFPSAASTTPFAQARGSQLGGPGGDRCRRLDAGRPIDAEALIAAGVIRRGSDGVRLLGEGELAAKITLHRLLRVPLQRGRQGGRRHARAPPRPAERAEAAA